MTTSKDRFSPFQFIKNIGSNAGIFVINTLISFWFTPFLINSLGSEVYGFIPLITSVVSYFGILSISINAATGRYLIIQIEQGNEEEANAIFNTTLTSLVGLSALLIPVGILLLTNIHILLNVPGTELDAVRFLLICSVTALILNTLRTSFSIVAFTQNRFDLRSMFNFLGRSSQVVVVAILFSVQEPNLYFVGWGLIATATITLLGDIYLWRRLLPNLKIQPKLFDIQVLKNMGDTSFWMLVSTLGTILYLNIEIILANRFLNLAVAGMYGAVLAIPGNLRTIANTVNSVWAPLLISKYSRDDLSGLTRVSRYSIKLIGLSIALPIGFVAGASREFLSLWLGPEFETFAWVAVVMSIHLGANLSTESLYGIFVSMNKLKLPALFTLFSGGLTIILGVPLIQQLGPIGAAIAAGVAFSIRNIVFLPLFSARLLKKPWWHYLLTTVTNLVITALVALVTFGVMRIFPISSWLDFLIIGAIISFIYGIFAFVLGLSSQEKIIITDNFF
jgi:membrane protein EpsK